MTLPLCAALMPAPTIDDGSAPTPLAIRRAPAPWLGGVVIACVLAVNGAPAVAQDTTVRRVPPAQVSWRLTVVSNGETVDTLADVTAVGQAKTVVHRRTVSHAVGCEGAHTAPTDLTRTITVAPLGVDSGDLIGFDVTAEEMIEAPTADTAGTDGCMLPPSIRTVNANHPEWDIRSGQSDRWVLLQQKPTLVYRLEATVVPPPAAQ